MKLILVSLDLLRDSNRETWANAVVFAYDVYEGFHAETETCAAITDLEDAYNSVPLDLLMVQLQLNISPY